jgi:hypothetical protein
MMPLQVAGQAASDVVEGLTSKTPWMLGILLLNLAGIIAAVYFLNILIRGQQNHLGQVLDVQQTEVQKILDMHNREFDSLTKMVNDTIDRLDKVVPPPQQIALPPEELPPEPPKGKSR